MAKPIQLDAEHVAFLESLVTAGRYASTDDAVLEGLKLLQAQEDRLSNLHRAWREGVESGDYEPLDTVLDDLTRRYTARANTNP